MYVCKILSDLLKQKGLTEDNLLRICNKQWKFHRNHFIGTWRSPEGKIKQHLLFFFPPLTKSEMLYIKRPERSWKN